MNNTSVLLEGYISSEPNLRKTKNGKQVCSFSLSVKHFTKNPEEEPKVSFFNVEIWNDQVDTYYKKLTKGRRIHLTGNLKQDRWTGKDGKPQSRLRIVGNRIRFLLNYADIDDRVNTSTGG